MTGKKLASIDNIIEDAKNGRMFILVDDETRENEGDLVIPAQFATPENINFMARHARGLICLTLTHERVQALRLPPMAEDNQSRFKTAFTVSIEAREGISTGISAADRAHTIQVAIDPTKGVADITSPGHIFPIEARGGGVLVRAGHTEASVDLCRMSGLTPAAVICEVMNEDGTMARMPDLEVFAAHHQLNIATIKDLIAYRRRTEKLVKRVHETEIHSCYGGTFTLITYQSTLGGEEHLALVKGKPDTEKPVLVRMHAFQTLSDVLGDQYEKRAGDIGKAMQMIAAQGEGVMVILHDPTPRPVSALLQTRATKDPEQSAPTQLRDYGIGAQILLDLGITKMTLLSHARRMIVGLDGYGLEVVGYEALSTENSHD
jgi:3,4-dihydroxy 2-butanone 4-phosphate synthase/GTP cyclohydrolase II